MFIFVELNSTARNKVFFLFVVGYNSTGMDILFSRCRMASDLINDVYWFPQGCEKDAKGAFDFGLAPRTKKAVNRLVGYRLVIK